MKMYSKIGLIGLAAVMSVFASCKKENCEEIIPDIEYKEFIQLQDSARLTITFSDCDGDIGASEEDTTTYNLFVYYYEFVSGEWRELKIVPPKLPLHSRISTLEPKGGSDKLEGDIEITLLNFKKGDADTIRYEVLLKDRALHESNRITTPTFVVP